MKKYSIIYADPPWEYKRKADTVIQGGCIRHYQTMNKQEIENLPIPELANNNCALFMWCTFPKLEEQLYLFKHWGFKYKTVGFTWVKTNPVKIDYKNIIKRLISGKLSTYSAYKRLLVAIRKNFKPFFGVGYYTKSNAEICLLGIKGKMPPINNSISSIIISPRREHSRKPDEVRDKIVKLFGDVPRIELFARQKTEGWDVYGDDVERFNVHDL